MTDYSSGGFGRFLDWGSVEVADATAGDLPYWDASGHAANLAIGSAGNVLGISGGVPAWVTGTSLSPPIGAVLAWLKSFTNTPALPDGWVECNGQTLSDGASVYNGQTIPNLNGSSGTQRFLRGSTTSGSTGGSDSHTHSISGVSASGGNQANVSNQLTPSDTGATSTLPSYYETVWILRVR